MENASLSPRTDRAIAFGLGLVAFAVYCPTLARTIYTGDDGDFLTAMATWGVSHPTGYPLFTLLGRLFLLLFSPVLAEPALRINVLTALCGAGAVGMLYRWARALLGDRVWAASATLLFAFSTTFWQQSLSCEVYALTAGFLFTCLYLLTLWWRAPENAGVLNALTVVYGLSLTNNLTMAVLLPGFLLVVLCRRPLWREPKVLGGLVWRFLAPLSLYLYLPLAARFSHSPVLWGAPGDLPSFWEHISGAQYRGLMFSLSPAEVGKRGSEFLGMYGGELGWFLAFAPLGLLVLWREGGVGRVTAKLSVFVAATLVVYGMNYGVMDGYVYYIPCYAMSALWIAAGGRWLAEKLPQVAARPTAVLAVAAPLALIGLHWGEVDKSQNYLEADFTENILKSAPKDALIVSGSSSTFSLWYFKHVKGERTDTVAINHDLLLGTLYSGLPWYEEQLARRWPGLKNVYLGAAIPAEKVRSGAVLPDLISAALKEGRPVLFVGDARADSRPVGGWPSKDALLSPFVRVPWGIGERLYLPGTQPPASVAATENERLWASFDKTLRGVFTQAAFQDSQQRNIPLRYFDALYGLGQVAEAAGRWDTAERGYGAALKLFASDRATAGLERCRRARSVATQLPR